MSSPDNEAVVRQFIDEWDMKSLAQVRDEVFATDFVMHVPGLPELSVDGVVQFNAMFHDAFPDLRHTIEDVISEDDQVVTRVTIRATHLGSFQGIPATGRQVAMTGLGITRVQDGKLLENWTIFDTLGLLQQIGAVPAQVPA